MNGDDVQPTDVEGVTFIGGHAIDELCVGVRTGCNGGEPGNKHDAAAKGQDRTGGAMQDRHGHSRSPAPDLQVRRQGPIAVAGHIHSPWTAFKLRGFQSRNLRHELERPLAQRFRNATGSKEQIALKCLCLLSSSPKSEGR
jgi:hypothetical protein